MISKKKEKRALIHNPDGSFTQRPSQNTIIEQVEGSDSSDISDFVDDGNHKDFSLIAQTNGSIGWTTKSDCFQMILRIFLLKLGWNGGKGGRIKPIQAAEFLLNDSSEKFQKQKTEHFKHLLQNKTK